MGSVASARIYIFFFNIVWNKSLPNGLLFKWELFTNIVNFRDLTFKQLKSLTIFVWE